MKGLFLLARRHLAHHRGRTLLLALATALACFLPVAVERLVDRYGSRLRERAAATPMLVGAKGSRYDLALTALYFKGRVPDALPHAFVAKISDSELALPIPLALGRTAQAHPLVGTSLDYFDFRHLELAAGTLPEILGDAVLGARAANDLGLGVGDHVLSDQGNVYDLSLAYPLKMKVVGVLRPTRGPDDDAVFVDVRTAWVVDGIGHGHVATADAKRNDTQSGTILAEEPGNVKFNAALVEYVEITPENIASFHFHGDPDTFPLSAVIAVPKDPKSATLLKGRFRVEPDAQLLAPADAIEEILSFVFQLKRFFDVNVILVGVATGCFLLLVVLLSLKVRARELETLRRIGCARGAVAGMLGIELLLTLGGGMLVAFVAAIVAVEAFARFVLSL